MDKQLDGRELHGWDGVNVICCRICPLHFVSEARGSSTFGIFGDIMGILGIGIRRTVFTSIPTAS